MHLPSDLLILLYIYLYFLLLFQKLWELAKEKGLEDKVDLLDRLMDHGRAVSIKVSLGIIIIMDHVQRINGQVSLSRACINYSTMPTPSQQANNWC